MAGTACLFVSQQMLSIVSVQILYDLHSTGLDRRMHEQ